MNATTEEVMRELQKKLETSLEKLGQEMEADLKKKLSIPVARASFDRGAGRFRGSQGRFVKRSNRAGRSKPGEYPRRETGRLRASATHVVYRAAGNVRLVMAVNVPYAEYIHRLRPFFLFLQRDWERKINYRLLSGS